MPHAIQRRLLAEELTRRRRADEQQRYAASQRRGRIDPNPHQIDAVVFALRRIPEGGCILADEVGLGKTIEAGLVIAQVLAEGWRRILLIVPKPLLGQWQTELAALFAIEAREIKADPDTITGEGVFLVGRELAGGEKGSGLLRTAEPFDLCVIDEAHEVFSGIWKRFDTREGKYDPDSRLARTADRVRSVLLAHRTPVLLLTATPIQNSLAELWALVQYVEPTGSLLGKLPTFRRVFSDGGDDRRLIPDQVHELKRRISTVVQRTLRRQAQEFLEKPFVERSTRLFTYDMTQEEKALYDAVTAWLLEPELCAFRGNQRRLLLIAFHRLMASSVRALAAGLEKVAERLRRMLEKAPEGPRDQTLFSFAADLEDEELEEEPAGEDGSDEATPLPRKRETPPTRQQIQAELDRVGEFIGRANALPGDSKAQALLKSVRVALDRGRSGEGSGKVVVFTESLTTQDYLARLLVEEGGLGPEDVTVFRGQNDSARANQALRRWEEGEGKRFPPYARPTRPVAMRLALVDEFKTRSKVFISTEAGAKGLNLQFCDTLINYDLPWNPQRIEQRIGRCHRYGQSRGVTVINFIARDNEAQRLTFEILSQKLELFGQVLDASDSILHQPGTGSPETFATALGANFERDLRKIYEGSRSVQEIEAKLRELRESMEAQKQGFETAISRAATLIETRFDDTVRRAFRRYQEELPEGLARLDQDLERLVTGFLHATGVPYEREGEAPVRLHIDPSPALPAPLRQGAVVGIGDSRALAGADPLHLGHPLVQAAAAEARAASDGKTLRVRLRPAEGRAWPEPLAKLRGSRGRLAVTKVSHRGFEPVDRLLPAAWLEGSPAPLDPIAAQALLELEPVDAPPFSPPIAVGAAELDDAVAEALFVDQARTSQDEQARFERALEQIERYVEDQVLVLRRECEELEERVRTTREQRDKALGSEARDKKQRELEKLDASLEKLARQVERLEAREDPDYLEWRARAHERRYARPTVTRVLDVEWSLG